MIYAYICTILYTHACKLLDFIFFNVFFFFINLLHDIYCIQPAKCASKDQLSKLFERKIVIIFLTNNFNRCVGSSKEPSHRDGSFECPQHMFQLRNKKQYFQLHTFIWSPAHAHIY